MSDLEHLELLNESAREAHARRDFDRALALCNEVIAISPANLKARFMRGLVNQSAQNHADAIADFADIIAGPRQQPVISAALYSRAVSFHAIGRFDEAAADCSAALEIDADNCDARYLYCISLKATGRIDRAIVEATRLIDARPDHKEAVYTRATLLYMNKDWSGAVDDFTRYLARTDTPADYRHTAYFFRGVSYHQLNANGEALDDLNLALTLQPDNPTTLARRALVYSALGKPAQSAADLLRVSDLMDSRRAN
jgi:tetratricopeptide (TPR) repeat protein